MMEKKEKNNIKVNFIYNFLYHILTMILPIITVPYISRVLGAEGVGIYSYTYSIVYYFMMIGLLGINTYGNRTIAKARDSQEHLSKRFIEIYTIQIVMNLVMIFFYSLYIMLFNNKYSLIAFIQIIFLFSNMFDINWFFFGIEEFKITVTRNTILKILALILIFLLVKTPNDLWIYTTIMSVSTLISQLLLFPILCKKIEWKKPNWQEIKKHIKPCLILFIPVISVSLYKVMDKLMIGLMCEITEVGFYEQAEKIINVLMGIITALGTVMLPHISNLVSKGKIDEIKKYIEKSINLLMFISFPMCLGLIVVSNNLIPKFLGSEFSKSSIIVCWLSTTIVFLSFASVIKTHYLIPKERDKDYIICTIYGAVANLVINLLLIPKLGSIGAAIGTVAAEFAAMFYQVYCVRKELPIKKYITSVIPYLIKALIMFIVIYPLGFININKICIMALQVVLGITVYGILNINYIKKLLKKEQ